MAVRPPLLRPVSRSANLTSVFLGLLYGLENLPRAFVVTIIAYDVLRLMGNEAMASFLLALVAIASLLVTLNAGTLIRMMTRKWVFTLAVAALAAAGLSHRAASLSSGSVSALRLRVCTRSRKPARCRLIAMGRPSAPSPTKPRLRSPLVMTHGEAFGS